MPAGIIIDGELVLEAGVFIENLYANFNAGPNGQGIVAVVGEFPFLEPGVVYLSTSQTAFEYLIAPNEPLIKRLAKVIYQSSLVVPGGPGAVILISTQTATQAEANFLFDQDDPGAVVGRFVSKIYGTRGNSTVVTVEENAVLGGYTIEVTVAGVTEPSTIQTSDESSVLTIDYTRSEDKGAWSGVTAYEVGDYITSAGVAYVCILAHTNQAAPNATYWAVVTTAYGLETMGGGSGVISAEKTEGPSELNITFARTIPYRNCLTSANVSWEPECPVIGALSVTAKAGVALNALAASVTCRITGTTATGATVEDLTLTPDTPPNFTIDVTEASAEDWLAVSKVEIFTDTNVSGHITAGNFEIAGTAFQLNVTDGVTTVADAITALTDVDGFVASTGSTNVSIIPVGSLDVQAIDTLSTSFSARVWSIEKAVNAQADFVEFEVDTYTVPDMTPTPVTLELSGGTVGVSNSTTKQAAFDELLKHNVDGVAVLSTADADIAMLLAHVNKAWGKYQNERTGFYGVLGNSSYATLASLANNVKTQRMQRFHQKPKVPQYLGAVETQDTPWMAIMAMAAANINRRRSLDKWQPNIVGIEQNASLNAEGMDEAMMRLAYNVVSRRNSSQPYKLLRELTTWLDDNNPYRTAGAAVRSSADMQRYVREVLEEVVESTNAANLLLGLLETALSDALEYLTTSGDIETYNRNSIKIVDAGQAYEAEFEYTPSGSKSQVKVKATVAAPAAA